MAHFILSAETGFSAAHTLPGVDMCDRLHGHNWRVRVSVEVPSEALDQNGMGVDFRALETVVRESVADFEHRHLNELEPFTSAPPTAERLAQLVSDRAAARLAHIAPRSKIAQVEVWEMPQYRVVFKP